MVATVADYERMTAYKGPSLKDEGLALYNLFGDSTPEEYDALPDEVEVDVQAASANSAARAMRAVSATLFMYGQPFPKSALCAPSGSNLRRYLRAARAQEAWR